MNINPVFGIILAALIAAFFSSFIPRKLKEREQFANDCFEFRSAFADKIAKFKRAGTIEIEGTVIYDSLTKSLNKHMIAVDNFQNSLWRFKRRRLKAFDTAWHQYQYPDNKTDSGPFGYYITPDENGVERMINPKFVLHKIKRLLTYANP